MWLKAFCHLNAFHQAHTCNSGDKVIFVNKILLGTHTEVCLAASEYTVKAGIGSWSWCSYKKTRRREKLSVWCQTVGSSLHERRGSLQGNISFLRAFNVSVNQIIDAEPWSHCMGVSFPTLLLILQSVDLFNVLIASSSGLYPTFLLFIGVSGIRNMQIRWLNSFAFCISPRLHLICFEIALTAEPQPQVCKPMDISSKIPLSPLHGMRESWEDYCSPQPGWIPKMLGAASEQGRPNQTSALCVGQQLRSPDFPKAALCSSGSHPEVQPQRGLIYSSDQL